MREVLVLLFSALFCTSLFGQKSVSESVKVAYQFCPFHCETYKINADFTFDYLIDGDLYNNQRIKGVWKFVGENRIHLKTPDRKLIHKVVENSGDANEKVLVQVTDNTTGLLPGVIIKINLDGKDYQFVTNENGICEIPRSEKIEVIFLDYAETYTIKNLQTTKLEIEIEPLHEPSIDASFLIKNQMLCRLLDNNEISENCYQKLNNKALRKLFPEN